MSRPGWAAVYPLLNLSKPAVMVTSGIIKTEIATSTHPILSNLIKRMT